jgi:outer membrane protein TolC
MEMLAQDRKITLSVQLDVKQSYLNYESAQARLITANKALQHSEENLRTVKEQYLESTRSVTDYLSAQMAYTTSILSKIQAIYDIKKAKAAIARSVGLFALGLREE